MLLVPIVKLSWVCSMRQRGKLSPTQVARRLGVHKNTVYAWCRAAVKGRPTKLVTVERCPNGYYLVDLRDVKNYNSGR